MGKIQQLLNQSHIEFENLPKTLIDQSFLKQNSCQQKNQIHPHENQYLINVCFQTQQAEVKDFHQNQ